MKRSLEELITYLFIAGTGTLIDIFLLYVLTDFFHLYYLLSATLSFILVGTLIFVFSKKYAFQNKSKKFFAQYFTYLFVVLVGLIINLVTIYLFVELFGLWYIYAKVIAVGVGFLWNYSGNKFITFRVVN